MTRTRSRQSGSRRRSPDSAGDEATVRGLLTDVSPKVRAAAIMALVNAGSRPARRRASGTRRPRSDRAPGDVRTRDPAHRHRLHPPARRRRSDRRRGRGFRRRRVGRPRGLREGSPRSPDPTPIRSAGSLPLPRSAPSATTRAGRLSSPRSVTSPAVRRRAVVALAAFTGDDVEAALRGAALRPGLAGPAAAETVLGISGSETR